MTNKVSISQTNTPTNSLTMETEHNSLKKNGKTNKTRLNKYEILNHHSTIRQLRTIHANTQTRQCYAGETEKGNITSALNK